MLIVGSCLEERGSLVMFEVRRRMKEWCLRHCRKGRDRNTHSGLVLEKTMNMSKLFRQEKLALGGGGLLGTVRGTAD